MATKNTIKTEPIAATDEVAEVDELDTDEDTLTDEERAEKERERIAEEDDLLAGMPQLADPHRLRIKHQNALKRISLAASPTFKKLRAGDRDDAALEGLFVLSEQIDAFAESIAKRPDEYAEWAAGKDENVMLAIFGRYTRARGE
jgi:hypothetical protein